MRVCILCDVTWFAWCLCVIQISVCLRVKLSVNSEGASGFKEPLATRRSVPPLLVKSNPTLPPLLSCCLGTSTIPHRQPLQVRPLPPQYWAAWGGGDKADTPGLLGNRFPGSPGATATDARQPVERGVG